ncbi:MAG: hypothetical protein C0597_09625 [Marinilabiliales bacterium]|nr:MAG: hypothetical protein C0597_09625 [Marinilabiliales bacterium]
MKRVKQLILILIGLFLSNQSISQIFIKKNIESFESTKCNLWGLTAIDYDSDGYLDLFGTDIQGEERLFRNDGKGNFILVNNDNGGIDCGGRESGISWGDYDNDGDPDPLIATQGGVNYLFNNKNEKGFNRIRSGHIVTDTLNSFDAAWVDYDNDGWLDAFASNVLTFGVNKRPGTFSYFYRNKGNGKFKKIKNDIISVDEGNSTTASFADYDNDGDQDLFIADMGDFNRFYTNNGDGTFTKVTSGDIVESQNHSLSAAWADYDNDGDLDIFVVNGLYAEKDALYSNNGDKTFTKILEGPLVNNPAGGWNAAWGDIDNDGDEDLYVSTWNSINLFYINNGDGTFTKNENEAIVTDSDSISTATSVWGDFDNDGDLDFITANCIDSKNIYYENVGNNNNWISIKLEGTISNRSAVGAQIRVKAVINGQEVQQMREISASNGFRTLNNGFRAHFGLGNADIIENIEVKWPSGKKSIINKIDVNQFFLIKE